MLIGGVIYNQFDDYLQTAVVSGRQKGLEIRDRAIHRMNAGVIGNVVAIVLQRRREKRQQPQTSDAEILKIIKLLKEPGKIADSIRIAIFKCTDVELVNDGIFVPKRVLRAAAMLGHSARLSRHGAASAPAGKLPCRAAVASYSTKMDDRGSAEGTRSARQSFPRRCLRREQRRCSIFLSTHRRTKLRRGNFSWARG